MRATDFVNTVAALVISLPAGASPSSVSCGGVTSLKQGIECVRDSEPAFKTAASGASERKSLRASGYRLLNPELELEYSEGKLLGDVQRETKGTLYFAFELGGKRSARAQVLDADGMELQADSIEQRIAALTGLGGSLLNLHQLEREAAVVEESASTFRKVIKLYRSRGELPPEQRVSLHAFELVVLEYERKLLEVQAERKRVSRKVAALYGEGAKGFPLAIDSIPSSPDWKSTLPSWIERTPEMLKARAKTARAEGTARVARADFWPDLKIGPTVAQSTEGPFAYQTYGIKIAFPIPLLSWNSDAKSATSLTKERVESALRWEDADVRATYESRIEELARIRTLLKEAPSESEIDRKHASTERLFERGLVSGALMIEAHRSLVEHYENRHALERELLEWSLKIDLVTNEEDAS